MKKLVVIAMAVSRPAPTPPMSPFRRPPQAQAGLHDVPPGRLQARPDGKCLTCHADINKGSYTLANGKENPHVSIHYLPETVDCNLCHREHGKSQNYCQACHADGLGFKVP